MIENMGRPLLAGALLMGLTAAVLAPRPVLAEGVAPAAAATETAATPAPLVITYAAFEAAVPHADLADCPAALAAPDRFCRITLNVQTVSVWVFSMEGDQPLIALQPYDIEELDIGF